MLTAEWRKAIESYLAHERAAGVRTSTSAARRQHLEHLARRVNGGPWQADATWPAILHEHVRPWRHWQRSGRICRRRSVPRDDTPRKWNDNSVIRLLDWYRLGHPCPESEPPTSHEVRGF